MANTAGNNVVISCAVTGVIHVRSMSGALPATPEQIPHSDVVLRRPRGAERMGF